MTLTRAAAFLAVIALMLVAASTDPWARGVPRHAMSRADTLYHPSRAVHLRDLDTALPAGFVDVSLDSSGNEHSQGMLAVATANQLLLGTLFYDSRSAFSVQAAYSQDGGNSWSLSGMPSAPSGISASTGLSDPTIAVDSLGRFYTGGSGPNPPNVGQAVNTYVLRSDDGGANFTALNPPAVALSLTTAQDTDFLDHQSNYADNSGASNNDYVSASAISTIVNSDGTQSQVILFNASTNGGQTWPGTYIQVNDNPPSASEGNCTPDTRVDGNGKVYVDWAQINASNQIYMMMDKATLIQGSGFGTDVRVYGPLTTDPSLFDGYLGDIRTGVFNTMAVDTSNTSTRGNVYMCWTDQVAPLGYAFKLFVARSQDGGNTFSAPIRVDASMDGFGVSSDHQAIPTVAVNPATGQVVITYYSTRNNPASRQGRNGPVTTQYVDANTPLVDLLCAVGTPNAAGGLDFAGPYRVTPASIDILAANQAGNLMFDPALGDYNGVAFRTVTNGINSALMFTTVDQQNRIVENAVLQFDGSAALSTVSGGTAEIKATATAPVGGLTATIAWGDGTTSTGVDVIHNYATGTYTPTVVMSDGSSAQHTITLAPFTSTGVFSSPDAVAQSSTVVTANTLAALGTSNTGGSSSGNSPTPTPTPTPTPSNGVNSNGSSTGGGGGGGGCFIATAAYGSYWEPHVMTLRRFRDQDLLTHAAGRAFVRFYYRTSPPIADWIRERPWARATVRCALTPMVAALEHVRWFLALFAAALIGAGLMIGLSLTRRRQTGVPTGGFVAVTVDGPA